jgi:hypothetical protein
MISNDSGHGATAKELLALRAAAYYRVSPLRGTMKPSRSGRDDAFSLNGSLSLDGYMDGYMDIGRYKLGETASYR